jgi:hypothetical protein
VRTVRPSAIETGDQEKFVLDIGSARTYADEVFDKLFAELGALGFMKAFDFRRVDSTIQGLINRSIEQRAKTGI